MLGGPKPRLLALNCYLASKSSKLHHDQNVSVEKPHIRRAYNPFPTSKGHTDFAERSGSHVRGLCRWTRPQVDPTNLMCVFFPSFFPPAFKILRHVFGSAIFLLCLVFCRDFRKLACFFGASQTHPGHVDFGPCPIFPDVLGHGQGLGARAGAAGQDKGVWVVW